MTIAMGFGKLAIEPGDREALIQGTVTYNVPSFEPEVSTEGSRVQVKQGGIDGVPSIQTFGEDVINEWMLRLGATPMALSINAGAATATVELGGLPLTNVTISQGASDFGLSFAAPNPEMMDTLSFNAGASRAVLSNLSNANAAQIVFKGGAGDYTLDFGGTLQRDVQVQVEAGVGQVALVVPGGTAVEAVFDGALTNVDAGEGWERSGDKYVLPGEGAKVQFQIKMGVGNLQLRVE
jgi:hypothetical protein